MDWQELADMLGCWVLWGGVKFSSKREENGNHVTLTVEVFASNGSRIKLGIIASDLWEAGGAGYVF